MNAAGAFSGWDYHYINSVDAMEGDSEISLCHLTLSNLTERAPESTLRSEDKKVGIFESC